MATAAVYYFSGHETFPFRYPWLKKGFDAVDADGAAFLRDDAIAVLGVGKNMVRSIRHWCLAAGIIQEVTGDDAKRSGNLEPTAFGRKIFATVDGLDPYLEDPATLWLIHWQIASNQSRSSTWYWSFSHFNEPEFTLDALSAAVFRWAQTLPGKKVAPISIHRDAECFLLTYVGSRHREERWLRIRSIARWWNLASSRRTPITAPSASAGGLRRTFPTRSSSTRSAAIGRHTTPTRRRYPSPISPGNREARGDCSRWTNPR